MDENKSDVNGNNDFVNGSFLNFGFQIARSGAGLIIACATSQCRAKYCIDPVPRRGYAQANSVLETPAYLPSFEMEYRYNTEQA